MRAKVSDVIGQVVLLMANYSEVIIPSGAGEKVLGRRGHTWYLRKLRRGDKIKLPAIEGEGAGEVSPL